jgi:hypothetical protein
LSGFRTLGRVLLVTLPLISCCLLANRVGALAILEELDIVSKMSVP